MSSGSDVDAFTEAVVETIIGCSEDCIPKRMMTEKKSTHEWLSPQIVAEVAMKNAAAMTPLASVAAAQCSHAIMTEFGRFVEHKKMELRVQQRGSKQWWKTARKLAFFSGPTSCTPALKKRDEWVKDPKEKADLFRSVLTGKFVVPELQENKYTAIPPMPVDAYTFVVTDAMAFSELSNLKIGSAAGPDGLPARILHAAPGATWLCSD